MRVNHFSTFVDGGAATAARRLHDELYRSGVDSHFYYAANRVETSDIEGAYHAAQWKRGNLKTRLAHAVRYRLHRQTFKRVVNRRAGGLEIFTTPKSSPQTPWPPVGIQVDGNSENRQIIHLHWLSKFIDYASFFESLPPGQPVVWTLHDMNAFTGGCHFSGGCDQYRSGCGNCPQLPSSHSNDLSRGLFRIKQSAIENINLHIVAPSRWLIESAQSSLMFRSARSFSRIPYGINTEIYRPMDKREARARLGIDPDATVVCFGAMDVKSTRKGAAEMNEAFAAIADLPGSIGLVFGKGELPKSTRPTPPIHSVGPIQGSLQQRTVFSAADVFVLPSLEDNLPLTGLEAMACGTPIVGFDAGGIPDYVRPGVSGSLAETGNSQDLGQKLRLMLRDRPACARLGQSARQMIENEYDSQREMNDFADLYAGLFHAGDAADTKPNRPDSGVPRAA